MPPEDFAIDSDVSALEAVDSTAIDAVGFEITVASHPPKQVRTVFWD